MKHGIRLKAYPKENLIKHRCVTNIYKYISTKIKIYNDTIHTEFKDKKILKDNKYCKYIPIEPKDGNCYSC